MPLLRLGRHFRLPSGTKVILSKNEREGDLFAKIQHKKVRIFEPANFNGPTALIDGSEIDSAKQLILEHSKLEKIANPQIREIVQAESSDSRQVCEQI